MNDSIFREYDIRGIYPSQINEDVAYKIGLGYGSYLQEKLNQTSCVVSHDNRLSSNSLYENLIKGLLETGINVISFGLTTTPMNYFGRYINDMFGIMITASHNPKDDNGFKFSFDKYANARGNMVQDLKNYINAGNFLKGNGILTTTDIKNDYIKYLKDNIHIEGKKLKVVFDPANGSVTSILNMALNEFYIDPIIINGESDGSFPNHHPDPSIEENLTQLKNAVLENNADFGIGFDGDGDRIGIIDNKGYLVSIEKYSILILRDIFDKVSNKSFLYDAKSSDIFKEEVEKLGGTPVICRTGSSYTQEKILKENIPYGFQYVGHIGFNDRCFATESAIYSSLRLVELLSKTDTDLHTLVSNIKEKYTTPEIKFSSNDNIKRIVIEKIKQFCIQNNFEFLEIDGLKIYFKSSWVYVRCSNTGPNITLRIESDNETTLNTLNNQFTKLINLFNNEQ